VPVRASDGDGWVAEKKGCHFHGFSLFSTPMAPSGAKRQIGFASFITG
jgi:hypothetical protein